MRVLITGANGQVGHELVQLAPAGMDAIELDSRALDITQPAAVQAAVTHHRPDLIINSAAYTAVDKAEQEPERAHAVNAQGVRHLAQAAEATGIPVFHISTDYVFDGSASQAYREDALPQPSGVYGASKLAGEQALIETLPRHLILRTSWVFGSHGNNFVKTMLRLGRERDELSIVADQYGGPTAAASIARALWGLAVQYQDGGALKWGLYHYAGTPHCTWYDFAQAIFGLADKLGMLEAMPLLHAIETVDFPMPAKRPAWSVLDSRRCYDTFGIAAPDWHSDLHAVIGELHDNLVD